MSDNLSPHNYGDKQHHLPKLSAGNTAPVAMEDLLDKHSPRMIDKVFQTPFKDAPEKLHRDVITSNVLIVTSHGKREPLGNTSITLYSNPRKRPHPVKCGKNIATYLITFCAVLLTPPILVIGHVCARVLHKAEYLGKHSVEKLHQTSYVMFYFEVATIEG
ncbi:MAG: hypothetical protein QXH32_02065 [Candidatus Caldarchaeum sp.]